MFSVFYIQEQMAPSDFVLHEGINYGFDFRDAFLEGDFSGCVDVARAVNTMQGLFGQIPNVLAHGRAAKAVINTLDLLNNQNSPKKKHQVN